jgi:hypothetical protein
VTVHPSVRAAVEQRVGACLAALVGGSGDLGTYMLVPGTFTIIGERPVESGLTEYRFVAMAWLATEHDGPEPPESPEPEEPLPPRGPDRIEGGIVLDADLALTRDDRGRVRLSPWSCFDPERGP